MMQNQTLTSGHIGPLNFRPARVVDYSSALLHAESAVQSAGSQRGENVIDLLSAAAPRTLPMARRATFILIGGLCVCAVLIVSAAAVATAYFL
jgi:hypothetical protein